MLYTPLPDLHETKYLEEKFYAETFPSIQKLKTVLFEIQQNKDDNQLTDIIGHHFLILEIPAIVILLSMWFAGNY